MAKGGHSLQAAYIEEVHDLYGQPNFDAKDRRLRPLLRLPTAFDLSDVDGTRKIPKAEVPRLLREMHAPSSLITSRPEEEHLSLSYEVIHTQVKEGLLAVVPHKFSKVIPRWNGDIPLIPAVWWTTLTKKRLRAEARIAARNFDKVAQLCQIRSQVLKLAAEREVLIADAKQHHDNRVRGFLKTPEAQLLWMSERYRLRELWNNYRKLDKAVEGHWRFRYAFDLLDREQTGYITREDLKVSNW